MMANRPAIVTKTEVARSIGRVNWLIFIGRFSSTNSRIRAMRPCASGCANWRMSVAGSGIGGFASCWSERVLR